jgi:UDP-N-acetylmuramyl pentapeptide synthase
LREVCFGHTTFRLSLLEAAETAKYRCCGRVELRNVLAALRRAHGASLEDIVAVLKE